MGLDLDLAAPGGGRGPAQGQQGDGAQPRLVLGLHQGSGQALRTGGGQPVLTGPAFVDKTNVASVEKYVASGRR